MDPARLELLKTHGRPRSPKWRAFRRKHLKGKSCAVCGHKRKLELHHIIPFHIRPELELVVENTIPLCEGNKQINCHLIVGHFDDFARKYNRSVRTDATRWLGRLTAKGMPA